VFDAFNRRNVFVECVGCGSKRVTQMWITTDQAIDIYARYCKARFGARAPKLARARVAELRESGDVEGERIWNEVSRRVEEQPAPRQLSALSS
jgi:hypothetical protein